VNHLHSKDIFDDYFRAIEEQGPGALADYTQDALWTPRATLALVRVGLAVFPGGEVTAKGQSEANPWRRSEYCNLDVCIVDPNSWSAPVFTAEHENSPKRERLQYDAWKLLTVEARRRVLVGYWGKGTEFKNFAALREAVEEVCADHPRKDILLVGGDFNARPGSINEFRKAHETAVVGVHLPL
jgi:hypothetical protein